VRRLLIRIAQVGRRRTRKGATVDLLSRTDQPTRSVADLDTAPKDELGPTSLRAAQRRPRPGYSPPPLGDPGRRGATPVRLPQQHPAHSRSAREDAPAPDR
jgi:hypothetical protein